MTFNYSEAINSRQSNRSFKADGILEGEKALLKTFIDGLEIPFSHSTEIRWFEAAYNKTLYTMFDSPKDNLAFLSETDYMSISKTGFVGELVILYATSIGLSTCWMGHYRSSELERLMPHLGVHKNDVTKYGYAKDIVEGRRCICTSPLGYWKESGIRAMDRMQKRIFSFKRKPIEESVNSDFSSLSPDIRYALDLAGKAPSALNKQFWQFDISKDQKTISLAMPKGYKHMKWDHPNVDIGICACHFWLGLKEKNIESKIDIALEDGCVIWTFTL